MKKITSLILFCSIALAAAAQSTSVTDGVLRILSSQRDAWNRGDLKTFMEGYWNSDSVTFVSGGTVWQGWDKVYHRYVKTYGENKAAMGHLVFSNITVIPLGEKAALAYGRWDLAFPGKKGVGGIFSLVFKKFPAGWRIIHDHTSRDAAQPVPTKKEEPGK